MTVVSLFCQPPLVTASPVAETGCFESAAVVGGRMVEEGAILDAFPDSKVPKRELTELESHDDILTAIPVMAEERGPQELADRVVVQTEQVAIVGVYDEADGWRVAHRVDGTDRGTDAVFADAMRAAQGDSSLVEQPEE